jgi:hypothetical protein
MKTIKLVLALLTLSIVFCQCDKNNDDNEPPDNWDTTNMAKSDKENSIIMKFEADHK